MLESVTGRWRRGFREVAECGGAAGLAWWLGTQIFGDHQPVFAAVAAIVCLAPGLPSHSQQAVGMLFGVFVGILLGEAAFALAPGGMSLGIAVSVFVAQIIAITIGVRPIIGIQSGASAVLVIAENNPEGGLVRLGDAAIGGAVALIFSQVLFTPDPLKLIREGARTLLDRSEKLADRLAGMADGEPKRDEVLSAMAELRDAEADFTGRLDHADHIARRTLRGRLKRGEIEERTDKWRRIARDIHLALGSTGYSLEDGEPEPGGIGDARERIEQARGRIGE